MTDEERMKKNAYMRQWRKKNIEKTKFWSKRFRNNNKALIKKRAKKYYKTFKNRHPERLQEIQRKALKKYNAKKPWLINNHKKSNKLKHKEWVKKHPENIKIIRKRAKAKRRGVEGSYTLSDWELLKKQYGYTCPCCKRKEPKIELHADHIIPIVKGGTNYIENIQPLCKTCNSRKYTKIIKFINI